MPYFIMGVGVAIFIGMAIILSYLAVWALLIGGTLYAVHWLRGKFGKGGQDLTKNKTKTTVVEYIEGECVEVESQRS